jgi:hypothetical protein
MRRENPGHGNHEHVPEPVKARLHPAAGIASARLSTADLVVITGRDVTRSYIQH